ASAILPFPPADAHIRGCPARTPALAARAAPASITRPAGACIRNDPRSASARRGGRSMPKPARRLYRVKTRHWHDRSQRQTRIAGKPALLVFERRKGTDVVDAMLFVKPAIGSARITFPRLAERIGAASGAIWCASF